MRSLYFYVTFYYNINVLVKNTMKLGKITKYINDAVLAIFGVIDILLVLRFMLKLIAARTESSFVALVYNASESFAEVFEGTLGNIDAGSLSLEVDTLIAIFVYFAVGLGLFKFLQAAFEKKSQEQIRLALDTLFKVGEVTLGMRLFFKLVGAGESQFIKILYSLSDVFYKPFEGLLPSAGADKYVFETATLIAIIILIVLDVATESLFKEAKKRRPESDEVPDDFVKTKSDTFSQPQATVTPAEKPVTEIKPAVQPTPLPQPVVQMVKGTIATILDNKKGQSAIMEIDQLLSPIFYKNPNLLTRAERNIVLVEELEREVNNGGFRQFFLNSSGSYAHETLAALTTVGSQVMTRLLKESISVFPNDNVPKINDIRRTTIASIDDSAAPVWNKLDTEFYKYDEDIYQLMINYIKDNIGDFR